MRTLVAPVADRLLRYYRSAAFTPVRNRIRLHARLEQARARIAAAGHRGLGRRLLAVELVELSHIDGPAFRGVFAPRPDIGEPKLGVDATFLEGAEAYYAAHQGFDYWRRLIADAARRAGLSQPRTVLEVGAGFGNSTLPILDLFPRAEIVATDISPNLLAILKRLLDQRDLARRCLPVAMDAHKPYFRQGVADLVIGSAILHHLIDPAAFIQRAIKALKPGGHAIFFEPFEPGHAVFRMICLEIGKEAARRAEGGPGLDLLAKLAGALDAQLFRHNFPDWREWNDKWTFTHSMLERIRREVGARDLQVYPIETDARPFTTTITYYLATYAQLPPSALPDWAWARVEEYETRYFPPATVRELILEGGIIFTK